MTEFMLTLIDARRIQHYLFTANELKQILGASELVERATHDWVFEALSPLRHNIKKTNPLTFDEQRSIEAAETDAELIFAGGGNVGILFRSLDQAKEFATRYSRKVLLEAPGLEVAIAHTPVLWDEPDGMARAWKQMIEQEMPRRKDSRRTTQPIYGLGVTAECVFTGMPAVRDWAEPGSDVRRLVSAEALAKLDCSLEAKKRLQESIAIESFEYPSKFDDLGGMAGHARYIAVIHIDGNDMGRRMQRYLDTAKTNRSFIQHMRSFSNRVNEAGLLSMQKVIERISKALTIEDGEWVIRDSAGGDEFVNLCENYLPIRPIVFGGDDVTFVCDGRLGLPLAVQFLDAFGEQMLEDEIQGFACAGVAIVHTNYPFARAYDLAEELCQTAKLEARSFDPNGARISYIHWHYNKGSLTHDWPEIRDREYKVTGGDLTLRPLVVRKLDELATPSWRTWEILINQLQEFRGPAWRGRRNKLKVIRDSLRDPSEAQQLIGLHGPLPAIASLESQDISSGWYDQRCLYFDALEADDLLVIPGGGER